MEIDLRPTCRFRGFLLLFLFLVITAQSVAEEPLYAPYILSSNTRGDLVKSLLDVKQALTGGGFELAGEYSPYEGAHVLVVTNPFLKSLAVDESNGAFMLGQRVSITRVGERVQVAYTNPEYFRHAFRIERDLTPLKQQLEAVLGRQESFGSVGIGSERLRGYRYAAGMPDFDDQLKLHRYPGRMSGVLTIEALLDRREMGVRKVYRIDVPGEPITVIGLAIAEGEGSDRRIMETIDRSELRHTAQLPYEILVRRSQVLALHPWFRLGIHFPDVRMVGKQSFLSLMGAPEAIEALLKSVAGGQ